MTKAPDVTSVFREEGMGRSAPTIHLPCQFLYNKDKKNLSRSLVEYFLFYFISQSKVAWLFKLEVKSGEGSICLLFPSLYRQRQARVEKTGNE